MATANSDFKVKNGINIANNALTVNAISKKIGINNPNPSVSLDILDTDAIKLPAGSSAERPSTANGAIRFNSELNAFEGFANNQWLIIAQAGANTSVFSTITTGAVQFEATANNVLSYNANTLFVKTSGSNTFSVNTSLLGFGNSTANVQITQSSIKISNSTVSIQIPIPSAAQVSSGSHFLNANGTYQPVVMTPAGANTQIQFNDSGVYAGNAGLTFNKTTNTLSVGNTVVATTFSGTTFTGNANTVTNITSGQITTALGYTPPQPNGTGATGTWGINISGNAATVANGVYTNGSYGNPTWLTSLAGSKISGDISGNASNITAYSINQNLSTTSIPTFYSMIIRPLSSNGTQRNILHALQSDGTIRYIWGIDTDEVPILWTYNTSGVFIGAYRFNSGNITNSSGNIFLNTANYTTYTPTLTGGNASGTWGINISGNAATATSSSNQSWETANTTIATTYFGHSLFTATSYTGLRNWNSFNNEFKPGVGPLMNTAVEPNGPPTGSYYYPLNLSYNDPALSTNLSAVTQLAISYPTTAGEIYMRGKYNGTWDSTWVRFLNSSNYSAYSAFSGAVSGTTGTFTGAVSGSSFNTTSDLNKKNSISDINKNNSYYKIKSLVMKNFEMNNDPGVKRAGVIAQEVLSVYPEYVHTDSEGSLSVDYNALFSEMIAAFQYQDNKINSMVNDLDRIKRELNI